VARPPASNREHPIPEDDEADYHAWMNKGGYSLATQLHAGGDERSVVLTVWGEGIDASRPGQRARPGSPKYLVDVELNPAGTIETVAAASVVDLMNLLATWAPVCRPRTCVTRPPSGGRRTTACPDPGADKGLLSGT
jgi:hypothetical protein